MANKRITDLPEGGALQATDEIPIARGGLNYKIAGSKIGGSLPAWWTTTDSPNTVDIAGQVTVSPTQGPGLTVKATRNQTDNIDFVNYISQVLDADGNFLAGFDWGGTLDLTQSLRVGLLPAAGNPSFSITAGGAIVGRTDGPMVDLRTLTGDLVVLDVNPQATEIATFLAPSNKIPVAIYSFGGTADGFRYYGPPDFNGEWKLLASGAMELQEQTDPAAPATNYARLYARDNGGGKTQIVARFPTGAVQVIATEP